ncbi:MAG: carboxypeptidase-like regulatory domain-containing protein, partial [Ginsengibacter sp.]
MKKIIFLFLLFVSSSLYAQRLTGTVHDADGDILPFASILIKNTTLGTTANKEGYFELTLQPGDYTIICRYVGYGLEEKKV